MTTGKTIALTRQTFVGRVTSLLSNMLSRLVITFLPRSKCLLISWLQSPAAVILEPPKIKSATVSTVYPSIWHEVMGPDVMILVFWMLSFKPTFSLSSFTFIKRLFSSSLLSVIRVSSHMLVKQCSKFSKPGFNNTWTVNFQMFMLVLEKAEEPEIKLPTSVGSSKKQESSRKTSTSALLTMPNSMTLWITTNWKIVQELGILYHLICLLRNLYAGQEATARTGNMTWNNRLVPNRERSMSRLYTVTLLI